MDRSSRFRMYARVVRLFEVSYTQYPPSVSRCPVMEDIHASLQLLGQPEGLVSARGG